MNITLTEEQYAADLKHAGDTGRQVGRIEARREARRMLAVLVWNAGGEIRVDKDLFVYLNDKDVLEEWSDQTHFVVRFKRHAPRIR